MNTGKFTKTYNVQPNDKQRERLTTSFKSNIESMLSMGWDVDVEVESGELLNSNEGSIVVTFTYAKGFKTQSEAYTIGVRGGCNRI